MLLSESLAWTLESYECSGIKVYCEKDAAKEIADSFLTDFTQRWEEAVESVEEEYGDCDDNDLPVDIVFTEYGFFVSVNQLEISYSFGNFYDLDYGPDAFNAAFSNMEENYPQIEYEGLIFYALCDTRCGEMVQYEISSHGNVDTYDFVGKALAALLADEEELEEDFASELESNEDFKESIQTLYAYKEYFSEERLENAIQIILNVAEEYDEDMEALEELIDNLEAGVVVEIDDDENDFSDNLPDGYMEALDMFMKAEELGASRPKVHEVVSSEGRFDLVIAKAEEGDAEAKFIAGKYFLADHIEEETERAIRWILEASEEGIKEAEEYILTYPELFE